jgi:hypothetical protein
MARLAFSFRTKRRPVIEFDFLGNGVLPCFSHASLELGDGLEEFVYAHGRIFLNGEQVGLATVCTLEHKVGPAVKNFGVDVAVAFYDQEGTL